MKGIAALAASLGFGVLICPVARADPLSTEDANYTKWLSENGVNYQDRISLQTMISQAHATCAMLDQSPTPRTHQAAVSRLIGGPGNFTQREATLIVLSAVNSYCNQHTNLLYP